jgi:hypothetical protein
MEQRHDSMGDRLMWTILVGLAGGVASMLAVRLAERLWVRMRHAPPPKAIGLIGSLANKSGQGAIGRMVH